GHHGYLEKQFSISVANRTCPLVSSNIHKIYWKKGLNLPINCTFDHMKRMLQLDQHYKVSWQKGCTPLNKNNHVLRLNRLSESDSGNYTCLANFTQAGHVYTAARTFQVFVTVPGPVPQSPIVVKPKHETRIVKVGLRYDLNCRVFIQTEDVSETFVYWLVNYSHTEEFPELSELHSWCEQEGSASYCQCNLSLDVHTEFLHVPFTCVALNSKGKDNGTVILLPASEGELYGGLALLTSFIILALGLLIFHLFKVDLVLSYRNCSPCLQRQNDGKLYDAYVSYPHGNDENTSSVTNFALRILPKVLEDDLGYRLFISGRDELPGAAVHDVIAEKVGKSRRLIIILSSQAFKRPTDSTTTGLSHVPAEHLSLSNDARTIYPDLSDLNGMKALNWGPYECWVGVYDALIKGHLQVILIQLEGEVDVSLLPESLRYISHTQGILRWKQDYSTKPNGKFWKQLRYRMPPVRKAKLAAIV
ncbi:hypothetical protein P4O66_008047, partial [Electrophorus voltai]